ncbi:MAG TPA: hypothetical protein VK973_00570 [Arenicellales bacterium]|nr:hypothetical protein [Arenicellales bacterium]
MFDSIVPRAEANGILHNYYVCVEPSADGRTADVRVYDLLPPSQGCSPGTVSQKWLYNAIDVPVPGSSPLSLVGEECTGGQTSLFNKLLDGLGVIRSAHAAPAFVELSSVENGAAGKLVFGSEIGFDIGPGSCSPPDCCTPPA